MLQAVQSMQPNPNDAFNALNAMSQLQMDAQRMASESQMLPLQVEQQRLQNQGTGQANTLAGLIQPYLVTEAASREPQRVTDNQARERDLVLREAAGKREADLHSSTKMVADMQPGLLALEQLLKRNQDAREQAQEGRAKELAPFQRKVASMTPGMARQDMKSKKQEIRASTLKNDVMEKFGSRAMLGEVKEREARTRGIDFINQVQKGGVGPGVEAAVAGGNQTAIQAMIQVERAKPENTPEKNAALDALAKDLATGAQARSPSERAQPSRVMFPFYDLGIKPVLPIGLPEGATSYWDLVKNENPREDYFKSQGQQVPPRSEPAPSLWEAILRSWPGTEAYKKANNKQ